MEIRKNIPLAQYTTFKIGGAAKFFCEAENKDEILEAVKFAKEKNLPIFILGGGSNILISNKGFEGIVIKILNTKYEIRDTSVECGAGCQLSTIVNESIKAGLFGLEWAAGIPGTIGGAVWGNAGAFGREMADCVEKVKVLDTGTFATGSPPDSLRDSKRAGLAALGMTASGCQFAYRDSVFKQNPDLLILFVTLKLKKGDRAKSEKKIKEILDKRRKSQPEFPTPGSFFKNPVVKNKKLFKEFEVDTGQKIKGNKIPAGYLIERAGLKGKKIGAAMVSEKHANFIVNTGGATAENIVMLAAIIKTRVRNKFGIQLKEEVQMVGF